jgi:ABC-type multidrug transport system ATPase subunit
MLEFKDVSLSVDGKNIVNDLSFAVGHGRVLRIQGGHGSGKSLILGAILGFCPIEKGFITLKGEPLTRLSAPYFRTLTAYMPQHFEVKDVKVSELFDFFVGLKAIDEQHVSKRKLFDYWDMFGLKHEIIDKSCTGIEPSDLQIIMLTLACLPDKELLLIDDSTSFLSEERSSGTISLLRQKASEGTAIVVASNDEVFNEVADEVIDLHNFKQQAS